MSSRKSCGSANWKFRLEILGGMHRLNFDYIGNAEKPDALGEIAASGWTCMSWYGAPGAIRTPDLLVRSQLLYPAELRAHILNIATGSVATL